MSHPTVISVENLGKRYLLAHQAKARGYVALRDVIAAKAGGLFRRRADEASAATTEEFWALRGVSFDIQQGDVVGIIGRNGAGKSTLLKILSRITDPTTGSIRIKGRIASLLEVGTGFHPELTGRENIYLNGAILGMQRAEIRAKFDEIVAFAEVERFLDTPVKRYSSGMYVRLAFAVAAHLEPEILIVDEVLAVGDAEFQKKCLGKMKDVSGGGRTVLFVSHNMAAIQALCKKAILFQSGTIVCQGDVQTVSEQYLLRKPEEKRAVVDHLGRFLALTRLEVSPAVVESHGSAEILLEITAEGDEVIDDLAWMIFAPNGDRVAILDLRAPSGAYKLAKGGTLTLRSRVANLPLVEGEYSLGLWVRSSTVSNSFMNLEVLRIVPEAGRSGALPREVQHRGVVELKASLDIESSARGGGRA
jgi:lipopolysaccharide transport system ATP-binding protein